MDSVSKVNLRFTAYGWEDERVIIDARTRRSSGGCRWGVCSPAGSLSHRDHRNITQTSTYIMCNLWISAAYSYLFTIFERNGRKQLTQFSYWRFNELSSPDKTPMESTIENVGFILREGEVREKQAEKRPKSALHAESYVMSTVIESVLKVFCDKWRAYTNVLNDKDIGRM